MKKLVIGVAAAAGALALSACSPSGDANVAEAGALNEVELGNESLADNGFTAVDGAEANGIDLNAADDAGLNAAGNVSDPAGNVGAADIPGNAS